MSSMCLRKERLPIDGDIEPSKPRLLRLRVITLWGCWLLHDTPSQSQKWIVSFHEFRAPEGSLIIPFLKARSANLSVSFPSEMASAVGTMSNTTMLEQKNRNKMTTLISIANSISHPEACTQWVYNRVRKPVFWKLE